MAQEATPDGAVSMAARLEEIAANLAREVARLGGLRQDNEAQQHLSLLRGEVEGMGRLIAETRAEVSGLMPTGTTHSRLTSASGELDAVVGDTERAAVEIMGAAERMQDASQRLRDAGLSPESARDLDVIESAATDIFMACSFQDLTGQRIRKVVKALTYIEQRVNSLAALWHGRGLDEVSAPVMDTRPDAHLLNGPSADGLGQHDIDALLGDAPVASSQDDIDALFG
jgi:chemotaxis regulatin CheY-phosphate phosphatase CheZ